ncbi:TPA: collagen-like protein [Streptococcus equi subsp. equi]|uniref:collagen-like protein n=4 Tax=Streptococcus equi TaxID=1336 RepID=UPI001372A40F|nr:collagen-like protein [Streptococcus equi]MBT1203218.1 collagen-like protein [Streptococcus equi subsp. equi]MBT1207397.1 collagen-like protein [Streptococcus equi subsp. equi]MBT1212747.1 collagen-like protein [Streptococcus equi subsp. equi]MBT1225987.1 collagen-like protein [Streptococcus equi subsp. equi]MBT1228034.1 collagen-like protein [Streptococcus equi subsp. equi]
MSETISAIVVHKSMTKNEWESSDIILPQGQLVYESDTGHSKFGDGKNRYADLIYQGGPPGPQGPQGLSGDRGPIGQTGPQGKQGVSVQSASVDSEGYLTVLLDNGQSFKSDSSLKGSKGDTGPKGADGKMTFEQLTPEQKQQLKGDKGDPGPKGDIGPRGATGPQGPKGEPGINGMDGPRGATGPRGLQGPLGKDAVLPDDVVRRGELAAYLLRSEYKAKGSGSGLSYKVVTQSEYDDLYDYSDNELILVTEG